MFRTLETIDGIEYEFSPIKFAKEIKSAVARRNSQQDEKCTQEKMYEEIAKKCMREVSSVKNWSKVCKANGPGDLSIVKDIASVLQINYMDLLTMKNPAKEQIQMESKSIVRDMYSEIDVIKAVYGDLMDFLDYNIASCGGNSIPDHPEIEDSDQVYNYQEDMFQKMHDRIDRSACDVSRVTWKKLHNIIFELEDDYRGFNIPDRWQRIKPNLWDIEPIPYDFPNYHYDRDNPELCDVDWWVKKRIYGGIEGSFLVDTKGNNLYETNEKYRKYIEQLPDDLEDLNPYIDDKEDYDMRMKNLDKKLNEMHPEENGCIKIDTSYYCMHSAALLPYQIYKIEFTDLFMTILREDFPQYFS